MILMGQSGMRLKSSHVGVEWDVLKNVGGVG
jgi:hypothetical protein